MRAKGKWMAVFLAILLCAGGVSGLALAQEVVTETG